MNDRVAILNGFGRCLGDGIIGLQALTLAIDRGAIAPSPVLFRLPGLPPVVQQLYALAHDFAHVADLPWHQTERGAPSDFVQGFRKIHDLRDFAYDPKFRGTAMIDYFLAELGVDPKQVPAHNKRNTWLNPLLQAAQRQPGYILLCPTASMAIRTMPPRVHDWMLQWLGHNQPRPVLTQNTLPPETSLTGLCSLVAAASLVISTDTAMVHLADALSVPCLAFFTTHRPEWRMRDYPWCQALYLPTGLPDALEFARDETDVTRAHAAWFPDGTDFHWLEQALRARLDQVDLRPDPINVLAQTTSRACSVQLEPNKL